ncbi:AAA family ATPase [Deinococcus sp.]|uniref:AAA family ATPase n=1 Tax=Deinococcus sp. TaxID=47478 RepID=UPI003B5ADA84
MPPVIWINGPFGVGKTHTAHALHARWPGSFVFDPEELGYTLGRLTPPQAGHADFQEHPLWVPFVVEALTEAARLAADPIIVPMTLSDSARFTATMGGLRKNGLDIRHFTLLAPPEVVRFRLRRRFEGKDSWAGRQVENRLRALAAPQFGQHLNTLGRSVDELAEDIAAAVGLPTVPPGEAN